MPNEIQVRVNFSTGEVELTGDAGRVQEWWERLDPDVAEFRSRFAGRASADNLERGSANPARVTREKSLAIPDAFGEFIHQFPPTLTDIERVLIAGYFAQASDQDNTFNTGTVNELLLQQGVRLTNPSSSIRRNVDSRRVILLGAGHFRVSQAGVEHLEHLKERQS